MIAAFGIAAPQGGLPLLHQRPRSSKRIAQIGEFFQRLASIAGLLIGIRRDGCRQNERLGAQAREAIVANRVE